MRKTTQAIQSHLQQNVTTLTTCWCLKLRDGTVFGFTEYDKDIIFDDVVYLSNSGFLSSAAANYSSLAADNIEVESIIDHNIILEKDLMNGRYDHAEVEIFMVNYNALQDGKIILHSGWFGEVKLYKSRFVAELRGMLQGFSTNIGNLYSERCRASLGDNKCSVDLSQYSEYLKVASIVDNITFYSDCLHKFDYSYGIIKFTKGLNKGLTVQVAHSKDSEIVISKQMPYPIQLHDEFLVSIGCNKSLAMCTNTFNNAVNFRGEPYIDASQLRNIF